MRIPQWCSLCVQLCASRVFVLRTGVRCACCAQSEQACAVRTKHPSSFVSRSNLHGTKSLEAIIQCPDTKQGIQMDTTRRQRYAHSEKGRASQQQRTRRRLERERIARIAAKIEKYWERAEVERAAEFARKARANSASNRFARNREIILQAKTRPCSDCGHRFPYFVMEFDHRPDEEKSFNISSGLTKSQATLEAEIEKCDLVCANCHRVRTHARGWARNGGRPRTALS